MSFVNIRRFVATLSVVILSPTSALCADQSELSELDYLNDIPVTFSATRLPQTLSEAPASVTIIDRRMIEASSATTIPELFRLVPGMQSYHIATNASAVAYHGMSDKFPPRMEVMINGRSVYLPLFSAVIWESLPISVADIERIEVIRGTNTVTQGSNAFLGAINIITHTPLSDQGGFIRYTQGEFNTRNAQAEHNQKTSHGHYRVAAGILGNDGYSFEYDAQDPYLKRYFSFESTSSPTLLDTITVDLGYSDGYSSVGDIRPKPGWNFKRREFETNFQQVSWTHTLQNTDELKLSYARAVNNFDARLLSAAEAAQLIQQPISVAQQFLDTNAPISITAETGNMEQHDVEIALKQQPSYNSKLISGLAYRSASAQNRQLLNTREWIKEESTRLFTNWEYSGFTDWTINTGALIEHVSNGSTRVSPRVAANYQLSNQSTIRTSVNRAYRMPSLLEANFENIIYIPPPYTGLYGDVYDYDFIANKDLSPEKLDSIDLGIIFKWPELNAQLDTRVYYEKIEDGITTSYQLQDAAMIASAPLDPDHLYRSYMNRAEWSNQGIEFQYKYQSEESLKPLLVINYGYIDSNGYRNDGNQQGSVTDVFDRLETRNPIHTGSILASITLPDNLNFSLSHYYLSSVRWQEGVKDTDPPNAPYHRTDLKISKGFRLSPQNELSIALIVQNLLDKPYSEFYAENMFEQRTYLQAQLSF
ncbi:Outer membrane cobalamin receptor protein [Amphritea atlantica]|uniref:Outer membrane cobalamin receptor protein n=1 Tax=Amphritea atlantica TaxID=355243 RepID=A0A1H9JUH8_9GAMM|nr:TonB-dependent receptor [Amphritea atlantica]SEQ90452.1 Outer membrane cobalamin receptor protein [Amphritea atlantica]